MKFELQFPCHANSLVAATLLALDFVVDCRCLQWVQSLTSGVLSSEKSTFEWQQKLYEVKTRKRINEMNATLECICILDLMRGERFLRSCPESVKCKKTHNRATKEIIVQWRKYGQ